MEKIFKKSLALILSAALCLTALVGCLTVSAAEGDTTKPVYSVNSVEGAAGAEVYVVASFSEISNVCAHHVIFTFPAGLEVTAVKNAAGEPYAAFDNSGERFDYKLDVAEDGTTKVQFLDFVNWAAENLSTTDMSIHFTVKIAAGAAANIEYPVTIAVQAADYAAENLLDVTCTNGKVTVKANTHEHTWDAGVMTTMPTTTSNGVVTYTCTECQETRTEDFVVAGTITTVDSYTKVDPALVKVNYAAKISGVFAGIGANGCTSTNYGMLLTRDGSEPVVGTAAVLYENKADNTLASKSYQGYFQNMNFAQMGQTLNFRPYVKFTRGEQECYYYGAVYSKVFIDAIRANEDGQSVALVALYDAKAAITDNIADKCTGTQLADGTNAKITTSVNNTKFDMSLARIQYAARIDGSVFTAIGENGGTVSSYSMLLSKDGTVPEYGKDGVAILYESAAASDTGNKTFMGYFQNMNIVQMGQTLTYRPCVKYVNADGETAYEYGAAVSFVLIDILRNHVDSSDYAAKLVSYYDAYYVK